MSFEQRFLRLVSFENRLLQLYRVERWCERASRWQQFQLALAFALILGTAAGAPVAAAPPMSDAQICEAITFEIRIHVPMPDNFSACPDAPPKSRAVVQPTTVPAPPKSRKFLFAISPQFARPL